MRAISGSGAITGQRPITSIASSQPAPTTGTTIRLATWSTMRGTRRSVRNSVSRLQVTRSTGLAEYSTRNAPKNGTSIQSSPTRAVTPTRRPLTTGFGHTAISRARQAPPASTTTFPTAGAYLPAHRTRGGSRLMTRNGKRSQYSVRQHSTLATPGRSRPVPAGSRSNRPRYTWWIILSAGGHPLFRIWPAMQQAGKAACFPIPLVTQTIPTTPQIMAKTS